jgi:hypothetical protein
MRNILFHMPRGQATMAAVFVRTGFALPDAERSRRQQREVITHLELSPPKASGVLADTEGDVTAYTV